MCLPCLGVRNNDGFSFANIGHNKCDGAINVVFSKADLFPIKKSVRELKT